MGFTGFKFRRCVIGFLLFTGCSGASGSGAPGNLGGGVSVSTPPGTTSQTTSGNQNQGGNSSSSNSSSPSRSYQTDAFLFCGDGTWSGEVNSIESILSSHGISYQKVTTAELNAMTLDDLAKFGMLIFPGGSGGTVSGSLTSRTKANIRAAVQQLGLSYVGFCAGAFIAVAPAPASGRDVSYGIGVVDGPVLDYYYLENQGTDIAMTLHSFADGTKKDILWYGGPMTPNHPGGVIAKYPDGTPAISQMTSGKGFVILSGGHPTATHAILSSLGLASSDGVHLDLAWTLIDSALKRIPMAAF